MASSEVRWATRLTNCKGNNRLKQIVGERNDCFRYVNEGFHGVEEGCKHDFEIEHGCRDFEDFAIEIPASSCLELSLLGDSAFFVLDKSYWRDQPDRGLLDARVLLVATENEYGIRDRVAMLRVRRQYRLHKDTAMDNERWGFCCDVYHYYDSHLVAE